MTPIRILHTADVHLDACFAAAGMPAGFGHRRRQALRDAFHAMIARAIAWPADAVLIAGDLFEHERVSRDTIAFLQRELASAAPIPVFIAPGNHDPCTPDSPYATAPWPSNVMIFRAPRWASHAVHERALTVHGFGFDAPDITVNPFGSLRPPADGRVHVAVAHGSERGHQPPAKMAYAPFDAAVAAAPGLAYLALGHFHAHTPLDGPFETVMHYSGAPEPQGFGEPGPHHYLEVEIEHAKVRVTPVVCSRAVYATHVIDCSRFATAQQLTEAIRALYAQKEPGRERYARITLSGACGAEIREQFQAVRDALAPDFEYLAFVDRTEPAEDFQALAMEPTSLGAFVRLINQHMADATEEAERLMLMRAREVGLAAYRGRETPIQGLEGAPS